MKLGVTIFATDRSMRPADVAREAEARGFHSLYVPEHTHIPVSRRTPPPTGDAVLAEEYKRTLDPWVALGAASAVTSTIRLGTGIALVAQHDAIALAKQIATLDWLSGGRAVVGIGYGWNVEEMEDHGIDTKRRRARVREVMLAMEALWANDVASFAGEHVRFEPSWQWPKPVQQPRPPVLIGGARGPEALRADRRVRRRLDPDRRRRRARGAAASCARRSRRAVAIRSSLHVVPMGVLPSREKLDYYAAAGVTEAVLRLPSAPRDEVLPLLDAFARFVA